MNDDKPHNEFVNPEFNDEHFPKQDMTSQIMNEEKPHNDFIHPEFNDEHYLNEDMIPIEQTTNAPNSDMTPLNTEASYVHIPIVEMNIPVRRSHAQEVANAGFDSKTEALRLQQYYFDALEEQSNCSMS